MMCASTCTSAPGHAGEWVGVGKAAVVGGKGDDVHAALRSPDDLLVVAAAAPRADLARSCPHGTGRSHWR